MAESIKAKLERLRKPVNFTPGSREKIAALAERADLFQLRGISLFVEGDYVPARSAIEIEHICREEGDHWRKVL